MQTESKRWIYLIVGTLINVIIGQTYAWSVFVKPLASQFGWTVAEVSVAFAIFHSISCIPIIIAGKMQDYVAPKYIILFGSIVYGVGMLAVGYVQNLTQLYLTYGVMGGISMGTIYSGVVPNLVRFFPDHRGMVSGILAAGIGCAAFLWAPVAAIMIERFEVLPTFKMLGTLYLVLLCALSLVIQTAEADFRPKGWTPSKVQQKAMVIPDKDWRGMLLDPLYYCLAAVIVIGGLSGLMIIAHASPILQSVGLYSAVAAGSWVGILALCNSGGRFGWGLISDRIGRMPSLVIIYIILGLAMLWLASTSYAVVVPILLVGMCFGGFMGMLASLTADAFGAKYLAVNFGVMFLPFGIGAFIGPRLAAVIKVNSGSYSQAFLIASALSCIAIGLAIVASILVKRKRQAAESNSSMVMEPST